MSRSVFITVRYVDLRELCPTVNPANLPFGGTLPVRSPAREVITDFHRDVEAKRRALCDIFADLVVRCTVWGASEEAEGVKLRSLLSAYPGAAIAMGDAIARTGAIDAAIERADLRDAQDKPGDVAARLDVVIALALNDAEKAMRDGDRRVAERALSVLRSAQDAKRRAMPEPSATGTGPYQPGPGTRAVEIPATHVHFHGDPRDFDAFRAQANAWLESLAMGAPEQDGEGPWKGWKG